MEIYDLMYKWVPRYVRFPVMAFMAIVVLSANGIFLGTTGDIYNGLGHYVENYTMAYNALYIGMGLGIMFYTKLGIRFSNKTMVISGLVFMLLMNIVCATTKNAEVTIFACFILGFTKSFALGEIYLNWLKIWSPKMDSSRLYPFFYFLALAGLYLLTWLTSKLAMEFDWHYSYIAVYTLLLATIILAMIFVENHPLKKRIPLYQADLLGLILIAIAMMCLNYVIVYGKVEDWFNSSRIILASFCFVITFLLFIKREQTVKRPFLNLHLLRRNNFASGLFIFLLMGIFLPSNVQSSFSVGILKYETVTNLEVNLFLIPGIFLGCLASYFWYRQNLSGPLLIIIGFGFYTFYYLMMYFDLVNSFAIDDFWYPSIIRGTAIALLYISIGLYTTSKFDFNSVLKVAGAMVVIRSFAGSGLFTGIYSYLLYMLRIEHQSYLANRVTDTDPVSLSGVSLADFYKNIQAQASLSASKELSGLIVIAGLIIITFLSVYFLRDWLKTRAQQ